VLKDETTSGTANRRTRRLGQADPEEDDEELDMAPPAVLDNPEAKVTLFDGSSD
jgi:hypothetical protein